MNVETEALCVQQSLGIDLLDKWELFVTIKNFFFVSVVYSHLQPWEDGHLAQATLKYKALRAKLDEHFYIVILIEQKSYIHIYSL